MTKAQITQFIEENIKASEEDKLTIMEMLVLYEEKRDDPEALSFFCECENPTPKENNCCKNCGAVIKTKTK